MLWIGNTCFRQEFGYACRNLLARQQAVGQNRFGDFLPDLAQRVERHQRILQNKADFTAANRSPVAIG